MKFLAHCQQSSGLIARADYLRSKTGEATLTLYGEHFCRSFLHFLGQTLKYFKEIFSYMKQGNSHLKPNMTVSSGGVGIMNISFLQL